MSLAQTIKEAIQTAQQPRKNILKLIVGELDRVSKTPTDKQTEAVLLFLIKSATETREAIHSNKPYELMNQSPAVFEYMNKLNDNLQELKVYKEFLPPQPKVLTQEEIKEVVSKVSQLPIPQIMKYLGMYEKEHFVTIDKAYARSLL